MRLRLRASVHLVSVLALALVAAPRSSDPGARNAAAQFLRNLLAEQSGVERPGCGRVLGAANDGPAVPEDG